MLRGQTPDAAIFNQARERPFQGPVSIRRFGVTVDFPAHGHRLGRGTVNVTAIPDLAMCVARAIVANQAQRLPGRSLGTTHECPIAEVRDCGPRDRVAPLPVP